MKKIWSFLGVIGSIFVLLLSIFLFSLKEEYELIYFNHTPSVMFTVKSVNSDYTTENILTKIENYAKENNINVYRQFTNIDESSKYNQDIYANIVDNKLFRQTFYINDVKIDAQNFNAENINKFNSLNVNIYKFLDSKKEGVEGFYQFQSTKINEEQVSNFLNSLGLVHEKTPRISTNDILDYVQQQYSINPLIYSLVFFLVTFIFVSLYEIFNRFKEIAILKMIGYKNSDVITRLIKEKIVFLGKLLIFYVLIVSTFDLLFKKGIRFVDFLLFSTISFFVYIVLILFIYSLLLFFVMMVDIPTMIKGKKNVKFIKPFHIASIIMFTIVLVFFAMSVKKEYNELVSSRESIKNFSNIKGYVSTNLSIVDTTEITSDRLGEKLKNFTLDNYDRIVLYGANSFFLHKYEEYIKFVNEEKPIILINDNYFKYLGLQGVNPESISQAKNDLTIIVPDNITLTKEEIDKLSDFVEINKKDNLEENTQAYNKKIIKYNSYNVPIYADSFIKYRFQTFNAPIYVVLNKENMVTFGKISFDTFSAWYSNGNIFISNRGEAISQLTLKYDLDRNIRSTIDIYGKLEKELVEFYNKIIIYICSFFTLLVVYYNLLMFSTLSYLEEKKQEIFCKTIMGYSFLSRHKEYLISTITVIFIGLLINYYINGVDLLATVAVMGISILTLLIVLIVATTFKGDNKI